MNDKIMVVDDDPSILIAVRELLESEGFEVFTAMSGLDCIDELKKGFKGVILMDIMMPIMDGWDTIQEIKNNDFQGIVIAMLTAKDRPDFKMDLYKDYVVDYIQKPFVPQELISAIKNYLNTYPLT